MRVEDNVKETNGRNIFSKQLKKDKNPLQESRYCIVAYFMSRIRIMAIRDNINKI